MDKQMRERAQQLMFALFIVLAALTIVYIARYL